jgi:hypothetical protein
LIVDGPAAPEAAARQPSRTEAAARSERDTVAV